MSNVLPLFGAMDVIVLPMLTALALLMSKVCEGDLQQKWEKHFLITLVVLTIVTIRTVIHCDDAWLIHTISLGAVIVAALVVPNQESVVSVS